MHIHTLRFINTDLDVECEGCDMPFRLATRNEAIFVQRTGAWKDDGPMKFENNMVVVPASFTVYA